MGNQKKEIQWSGKDVTKCPVIGILITKPLSFEDYIIHSETYEVIEIVEKGTIYVTYQWYKPGVPQIIHKDLIQEYIPDIDSRTYKCPNS